jgi:hypothetical protein
MNNLQQTSRVVEKIFSSLLTAKSRENRLKECQKLLHIFENNMVLSIRFDSILNNIDDFSTIDNLDCKKLWLNVINRFLIYLLINRYQYKLLNSNLNIEQN